MHKAYTYWNKQNSKYVKVKLEGRILLIKTSVGNALCRTPNIPISFPKWKSRSTPTEFTRSKGKRKRRDVLFGVCGFSVFLCVCAHSKQRGAPGSPARWLVEWLTSNDIIFFFVHRCGFISKPFFVFGRSLLTHSWFNDEIQTYCLTSHFSPILRISQRDCHYGDSLRVMQLIKESN